MHIMLNAICFSSDQRIKRCNLSIAGTAGKELFLPARGSKNAEVLFIDVFISNIYQECAEQPCFLWTEKCTAYLSPAAWIISNIKIKSESDLRYNADTNMRVVRNSPTNGEYSICDCLHIKTTYIRLMELSPW